ncbi:hypothetical protein [Mycoplasma sp. CSL10137]|uniref:hypothetical protein n=1 Tax=Mycoplasma sp. CSL10137 TaxID=2813824 RepID=UPI00197B4E31|nr:hypothetical protein [Mycoplasma sp. CSL10137]
MEKLKNKLKYFLSINIGVVMSISTLSCSSDKKEIEKNIITNNKQKGGNGKEKNNINTNVALNKERDIFGKENKTMENKNINYKSYEQHVKEAEKFLNLNQIQIKKFQIDVNNLYTIIQKHKKSILNKNTNIQLLENDKNELDKSINNIKQLMREGVEKSKLIDSINECIVDINSLIKEVEGSGYAKETLVKLNELINKMKIKEKNFKNTFKELKDLKEKLITQKEKIKFEYRSNLLNVQKELFLKYNLLKDKLNISTTKNDNKITINDELKKQLFDLSESNLEHSNILSNIEKVKRNINEISEILSLLELNNSIKNINLTTLQSLIERAKYAKIHSETYNIYHPLKSRAKEIIERAEKIKECELDSSLWTVDSNNKNELFSKIKNIINVHSSLNEFLEDYSLNAYYPEP